MKTEDHYILGEFVLNELCCRPGNLGRRLFLLGCVEPDYNILSFRIANTSPVPHLNFVRRLR